MAVEPANVITQSKIMSIAAIPAILLALACIGIAANSIIVAPQPIYPYATNGFLFPVLSHHPPAKIVVTVAVKADNQTIKVVTRYDISVLPELEKIS